MKRETLESRFRALHYIIHDINSSLELEVVLNSVMDKLIELMHAERGFILLGEDDEALDSEALSYQVARNFVRESISESDVKVSRSVIQRVLRSREGVLTMSALDDKRFNTSSSVVAFGLRSILCVPLQVRGRTIGVIYLDNTLKTGAFDAEDQEFLETFAGMAAIAIDNARLFGDLHDRMKEMATLKRYMDAIFDGGALHSQQPHLGIDDLVKQGQESVLQEGDYLWHEDDPGDYVALLVDGTLEVLHEASETETVVLRRLERGAVLGEMACLEGQPRSASVRAATQCRVQRIPADQFREVMKQRPDIIEALFWQQVERVRSLTNQVNTTHHTAITDRLTKLYNFGFFRERLHAEVERARHTGDSISLIIFDIDHFKHYNDHNGHQEGNVCLSTVADIIRQTGRRSDIVARYGGEEFVVLLYGSTREEATRFAELAGQRVQATEFLGSKTQPLGFLSVSGGVATYPVDADTDAQLIEAADANLYTAKESGRNRVVAAPRVGAQTNVKA